MGARQLFDLAEQADRAGTLSPAEYVEAIKAIIPQPGDDPERLFAAADQIMAHPVAEVSWFLSEQGEGTCVARPLPVVALRGEVVDGDGPPPTPARITHCGGRPVSTEADGTFLAFVPGGIPCTVTATGRDGRSASETVNSGGSGPSVVLVLR